MKKESLEEVGDLLIKSIETSNITLYEKIELLLNLRLFLEDYDNNIKVLKRSKNETDKRVL